MTTTKRTYERLAILYDLDDAMFFGLKQMWRKKIIDDLNVEKGQFILDIATGTGRAAKILSKRAEHAQIVAIDFSKSMMDIARIRNRNRDNIAFILCDAAHLPFKDGIFDAASCMCGMDTVDDPDGVVSEATRVLKKKKRFGMMYFRKPKGWAKYIFAPLMKFYDIVWKTGYVDLSTIIADQPLTIIKNRDLILADALVVERE